MRGRKRTTVKLMFGQNREGSQISRERRYGLLQHEYHRAGIDAVNRFQIAEIPVKYGIIRAGLLVQHIGEDNVGRAEHLPIVEPDAVTKTEYPFAAISSIDGQR